MQSTLTRRQHAAHSTVIKRLAIACALVLAGQARADVVTDWNAVVAGPLVAPRFGAAPQSSRALAMIQIAVHDALNSIDRRYETYDVVPTLLAPLPESPEKTAATIAVRDAFRATLGPMPYSHAKMLGIAAGQAAASAILRQRRNDGSATPSTPYTLLPGRGIYQPTPNPEFPDAVVPAFGLWGQVTPFAVRDAMQFRAPPGELCDLGSETYTRNYKEVKHVGDALVRGTAPDSAQSDIARFWPGGGANWNLTTRVIVADRGLNRWQHARLFALLNIAEADGLITTQGAKYAYNFWRPVTAIRWAHDGNPATASDAGWRPFLTTPPYPDYPCGLPTGTGATTEVLRSYFGTDDIAFDRTVDAASVVLPPLAALPPKTIIRHFDSLSAAGKDAINARVYSGIHFRSGCNAGLRTGTQVGRFVFQHYLKPVH